MGSQTSDTFGSQKIKIQVSYTPNCAMFGETLRDQIRNEEIRRKTRLIDIAKLVANLKWKWKWAEHIARRTDGRWGSKVLECRPAHVNAALIGPQQGGQTTLNASLETSGPGLWILELPTKDCPAVEFNQLK
ncbi:jg27661 [Pararge aegeria aegeria]|uniref:Jg27661 protein n=1 Tax=Pararge aegeria aegeria TaxID=348720 RepID=A0A8S4RPC5_9NEOP|nr:jg27661 [Pararge aegeria aegeria]